MKETAKEQLYDLIVSGLPVALFIVDASFRIVEFSQAAEEISGWSRKEVLGHNCAEILASSLCQDHCPLQESLHSGKACVGREALIVTKDKKNIPIIFSSSALTDNNGNLLHGIEIFRDASIIKKLEEQKKNIISLFTHDLKSPVAIAGGFVERLLKEKAGPLTEKQQSYLKTIRKEINKLEKYIFSFLDISKIEAGQIELQIESLDIGTLLSDIVDDFRLQASKKDILLQRELPEALPSLRADSLQLTRVFSNLLDNAIKYSEKGTVVLATITFDSSSLTVEIRDQGSGIAADQLDHIFDSFYRVPGEAQKAGGTGLGLAAVKAIVEAHGGTTHVQSELGRGSSFFISFPLKSGEE